MRFLSPHAAYSIQVIEGNEQVVVDARGYAQSVVIGKPVVANFDQGGLLDHEIEAALENFTFSGVPEGVNPLTTVATFDTEAQGYSDELFVKVNDRLIELQKLHRSDYIHVPQPRAEIPWPNYGSDSAKDIIKLQERLGIKAEKIRLYELENENRSEIVLAMLELDDPEGAARLKEELEAKANPSKTGFSPGEKPGHAEGAKAVAPELTSFPSPDELVADGGAEEVVVDA